jgi:hypothetical protein
MAMKNGVCVMVLHKQIHLGFTRQEPYMVGREQKGIEKNLLYGTFFFVGIFMKTVNSVRVKKAISIEDSNH